MKHSPNLLLALGLGFALTQSANASILLSDSFNYTTPGSLGGNVNPTTGYTWTGGNNLTIASGNLTYAGLQDLGGNELSIVNGSAGSGINVFANTTSGSIYYSFLLDTLATPTGNSYLTALNPGTGAPNGSSDAIDMYIYSNTTGYRLGLRAAPDSAVTTSSTSPLSVNTTYLVVLEYDFGVGTAELYLNPTPGDVAPTPTLTLTGTTASAIDDVGFKSQSATGASYLIDNVLIGTQWSDVTPSAVPEPAAMALLGLGALGLAFAKRMRR